MNLKMLINRFIISSFSFAAIFFSPLYCAADEAASQLFSSIKEYALFADAAYQTQADITNTLKKQAYQLTRYSNIPDYEVSYFLAKNDRTKRQVLSVRGTSNVENVIVNISLQLSHDKHTGIRLHQGFAKAAQHIFEEIKPQLHKDYTIDTTGHSLGGAVALILAMYLDVNHYTIGQVVTFGQPKLTNIIGAQKFKHLNVTRLVTLKDVVPLVPPFDPTNLVLPFDPTDINNLDIYWHLGREILLLPGAGYSRLEGLDSMLRATKFLDEQLSEENVEHHKMSFYMELINIKLKNAKEVPY